MGGGEQGPPFPQWPAMLHGPVVRPRIMVLGAAGPAGAMECAEAGSSEDLPWGTVGTYEVLGWA